MHKLDMDSNPGPLQYRIFISNPGTELELDSNPAPMQYMICIINRELEIEPELKPWTNAIQDMFFK